MMRSLRVHAVVGLACSILFVCGAPTRAADTATIGLPEGDPAGVRCPQGYLAGFAIWYDNSMSGLQPYCARMQPNGDWEGGAQIHLDLEMSDALPGGRRLDMFCPRDFYVFGFKGHSHVYGIHSIMQLTLTCRNARTGALIAVGLPNPPGVSLTEWPAIQCNSDSVANGVIGRTRSNSTLTQFGLSCARTPITLVQPAGSAALDTPRIEARRSLLAQSTPVAEATHTRGQVNDRAQPKKVPPTPERESTGNSKVDPSGPVTLNPQPLPPKATATATRGETTSGSQSKVDPSGPVTLNPQPLPPKTTQLAQPGQPVLVNRQITRQGTGSPASTRIAEANRTGGDLTKKVDPPEPVIPRPEPARLAQPGGTGGATGAVVGSPSRTAQPILGTHRGTGDLPGAAKILCRGGKSMRLEQMSEETARALGRGQAGATYSLFFGTTEGTVSADGNGLHASTCAFLGQPWKPGDPPGIRFDTNPDGAFFYNKAPRADAEETRSRPHYLDRPDHYWLFTVKPAHGFYEAVSHDVWKPAATPTATQPTTRSQNSATVSRTEPAQPPASKVDPSAPVVAQSRPSTSARIVQRQQPVVVKPPTQTMTTGGATSTKVQQSQQAIPARPGTLGNAAAGLDIQTEEIRCKGGGGPLLRFENIGAKPASAAASDATIMALYFNLPKTGTPEKYPASGADGTWLEAGTCAFAEREFIAGQDPPAVRFETPVASPERTARKMQHGSSTAADVSPDHESIQKYLESDRHFWRFVVYKTSYGYFQAVSHEAWKPVQLGHSPKGATQIAGVAENAGSDQIIARLLDVQVLPDLKSVGVRFTARPDATPTVAIAQEPAVADASGRLTLRRPLTQFQVQRDNKNSNATVTRYVGTSAPGTLEPGTPYHYLVTVPGAASIPTYQDTGSFRTLSQTATVHFTRIHVIDDSDDEGSGELRFSAYISRSKAPLSEVDRAGDLGRFNIPSGENRRVTSEFVIDNAPEVLTIQVQGRDDDTPDAPSVGEDPFFLLSGPKSSSYADANLARQSFDLSKHWLRSESLPFVMRTNLVGGPASRLLFEVHGYIEIRRPEK